MTTIETDPAAASKSAPPAAMDSADEVRADREGWLWWIEAIAPPAAISWEHSASQLSEAAIAMMVGFAVRDEATYRERFSRLYWPGGEAGVTLGIGYDLGHSTSAHVGADWAGVLDGEQIHKLASGLGVWGDLEGRAVAQSFQASGIEIAYDDALMVFRDRVLPRWTGMVERALPNSGLLTPDQRGALVSLAMSRGATFAQVGGAYAEMRRIAQHLEAGQFARVPAEIRAMTRLYASRLGLQNRRMREAALFEDGTVTQTEEVVQ